MTAREMFRNQFPQGRVLLCSKGRYDYGRNTFAYCICRDGNHYNIKVLSEVNPREYSVPWNPTTTPTTLETAILYNEWRARVMASKEIGI